MNPHDEILKIKNELLDEFDKRVEALKVEEQEFPQKGYEFWFITSSGDVAHMFWHDDLGQEQSLSIGNVFRTKEQAEFAVEKLKVEAELRKYSRPFKDNDNNYYIELYLFDKTLSIDIDEYFQTQGTIYFESKKVAQQAIEKVGEERIKKYIFGVED